MILKVTSGLVLSFLIFPKYTFCQSRSQEPIKVITPVRVAEANKVKLGKMLFFEKRLSDSGLINCNSCHNLSSAAVDNVPFSRGPNWKTSNLNTPTLLNAKFNIAYNWDGSAKTLLEQIAAHMSEPKIMDSKHPSNLAKLKSIPEYQKLFTQVYGAKEINLIKVTESVAAFIETLLTPGSRFDKWLNGDGRAITTEEKRGYELFKQKGCISCHSGAAIGSSKFQKFGLVRAYKKDRKTLGRFNVTKQAQDKYVFKVPTLRNIELTYPYFHNGSVWQLSEAVDVMAWHQLGIKLRRDENRAIVSFLKTLTGTRPRIDIPALPPSQKRTEKPNTI